MRLSSGLQVDYLETSNTVVVENDVGSHLWAMLSRGGYLPACVESFGNSDVNTLKQDTGGRQ